MLKQFFTVILAFAGITAFAQNAPVIEGTYFPVRNTKIKQIWDTTPGVMQIPTMGANQVWDYRQSNGQFVNICDTFDIKVYDPALAPKSQYFPGAAFAIFMRTPLPNDPFDSLYHFYSADHQIGLRKMGGFNISPMYDSTLRFSPEAFFSAPTMSFGFSKTDTAKSDLYVNNYMGLKGKIKTRRYSTYTYVGYGTLKLPSHTYNNVAQVREVWNSVDSMFVDIFNNGNYVYYTTKTAMGKVYNFYRNNTFGTAYLMYLNVNPANTVVEQAFFTLPADIGTISGKVFTNSAETTPVTNGEMYLYREHSNFTKHDILARTNLDASGNFKFDSIPYGEYLIAVRPSLNSYPNSMITYVGDTTDWVNATTIITTTNISTGHKIHLRYHNPPAGINSISGQLNFNFNIARTNQIMQANPVPGIGIVVKKNPGGTTNARLTVSDTSGKFVLSNLNDGNYTLFVDIPGLHMAGTYSFSVVGGNSVNSLDFVVGKDSIHPASLVSGIKETKKTDISFIRAYPNPYNSSATIELLLQNSANVTLEVYNMIGEKIQTLDNSQKTAGTYKYSFSAKSQNYSAGIYFVKCKVGNSTSVIKLIEQ